MARHTMFRSLHDVGLAAWFGGTLANAVALNPASAQAGSSTSSGRVANAGWDAWTPVNAAAIGSHLVGSVGLLLANRTRLATQEGVATMAAIKTGVTVAALGATAYSRLLGQRVSEQTDVPVESATEPSGRTPSDTANAQQQLSALQWAIPALTGLLIVVSAFAGEQQRPGEVRQGIMNRFS
ncbi:MAG: hypothetical protein H0U47_04240 [Nocardioidaceae bacterium]|nr:hypothetical protein [Nocardioidaceae bacterium]